MAVFFGWETKVVNNDITATILIRAIHLMTTYLGVWVHVQHVLRCSDMYSTLTEIFHAGSRHVEESEVHGVLIHWLENPTVDWSLPEAFSKELRNKI